MALFDLLGRRWALRILWELRNGPLTSRALRAACGGVSPTVLQDRTAELRAARLIELVEPAGYGLSAMGRDLGVRLLPVVEWSERWAAALARKPGG
jgi:DNA-binding HxlR family transcriptional regulator